LFSCFHGALLDALLADTLSNWGLLSSMQSWLVKPSPI
jgi:hypothetical protein